MEKHSDQTPHPQETSSEQLPVYLSVREAARVLGVSERSVYGYIETGKLPGARLGNVIVVTADAVYTYQRRAPGRVRTTTPPWRRPPLQNLEYLTTITVRVYPGQDEMLERKLHDIHSTNKHRLPGTAARYIVRNEHDPEEIDIILIWRSVVMPPAEMREASLTSLYSDLAEVLDWGTASLKEGRVLLHA
ncbi:MAG TPA: helix-turn-helix domain-containing protein [Ktedonobacteraceae bacterium]